MNFNIIGYLIFASVTCVTPGPNNLMLFAYGKAYGFDDSGKVMLGIGSGFFTILYLAGYGVANIVASSEILGLILRISGSIWMLYLGFILSKMSTEIMPGDNKRITFSQAYFQQFVNLKAWVMAISGAGAFMPHSDNIHLNVFIFAAFFVLVGIPSMIIWLKMGDVIAKILRSQRANKILGYTIFSLMIVSVVTIWIK
jgi:threonine/homoserine/homoserine lactone efflux protein